METRSDGESEKIMKVENFRERKDPIESELDALTEAIIGACIEVHREFGPGLAEKH